MTRSRTTPLVLALALTLVLAPLTVPDAEAAPPQATGWGSLELEGQPTGLGFLDAGYLVVATSDAGGAPQSAPADCNAGDGEDADLYLIPFPNGTTCAQSQDTGAPTGQEGILAMDTAFRGGRAVVGLPTSLFTSVNLAAYDLEDGQLTRTQETSVNGDILHVATDTTGSRTIVAAADGGSYRLTVHDADLVQTATYTLQGQPRDIALSSDGRWAAAGGNFSQGNTSFGYVTLFDLSKGPGDNPVLDQQIRQAEKGVVGSVAVSLGGQLALGTAGGQVQHFAAPTASSPVAREAKLGNATARVDISPDGSHVLVGADRSLALYDASPEALDRSFRLALNTTVGSVAYRSPYLYALGDTITAVTFDGQALWQQAGGDLSAVNATGLGLAGASGQPAGAVGGQQRTAVTGAQVHANLTVAQDTTPTVPPGDIGEINITFQNTGAAILNLTLDADPPAGVSVETAPDHLELLPGATSTMTALVEVGPTAQAGETRVPVRVLSTPATDATTNLTFTVGTATAIDLRLEPGTPSQRSVVQGQNTSVALVLENKGNTEATVDLEANQFPDGGPAWPIEIQPHPPVTIAPGSVTTLLLQIEVPQDAADGTVNRIVARATTQGGAAATGFTFTVNPFEALDIEPRLRTKLIAPGGDAAYDFTLQNLGSVASNVTLTVQAIDDDGNPYVPGGWSISSQPTSLQIPAGAERRIQVNIAGPPDASDGDRLRTRLIVQTDEGTQATSLAYAVVDTSLAEDPPEDPKREPLGLLAPLLALGLAAAAGRWRRARRP